MWFIRALLIATLPIFSYSEETATLITKQPIDKIKYLSSDGKYTYYKRHSGDLMLATNYDIKTVLAGNSDTDYLLIASSTKKRVLIEKMELYYKRNNGRAINTIFVADYGNNNPSEIGKGQFSELHLADSFATFFVPGENKIITKSLESGKQFEIVLLKKNNPYFIPETVVINNEEIVYTDVNSMGETGVIMYNMLTKSTANLLKSKIGSKIELAMSGDDLVIGEFPLLNNQTGSSIKVINKNKIYDITTLKTIYETKASDVGNVITELSSVKIYFIKQIDDKYSEVVALDKTTGKLDILTNLRHATQILAMDGDLIVPLNGQVYTPLKVKIEVKKDSKQTEKSEPANSATSEEEVQE